MAANPVAIFRAIDQLAPPVLDLLREVVEAISGSKTKRDAARRIIILAAKKTLTG